MRTLIDEFLMPYGNQLDFDKFFKKSEISTYPFDYYVDERTGVHYIEYMLAGVEKDRIKVKISQSELNIVVDRKHISTEDEVKELSKLKYYHKSSSNKSMQVNWKLDDRVDYTKHEITFRNGILKIALPMKKDEAPNIISASILD